MILQKIVRVPATLLILCIAGFSGCKKFVEIPPPINPVPSAVIFMNDPTAIGTLSGIYSEMMNTGTQFSASGITFYGGMCADELSFYTVGSREEFIKNQLTQASHSTISTLFWDRAYKYIYTANLCLEGLAKSPAVSPEVKNRLIGEAKFVRAFCYFHLVNLFGAVPMPITSDYRDNISLARSSTDKVYAQIIADLLDAQSLLPSGTISEKIRPGKWTAAALLARVYLYRGNWTGAEERAGAIIDSGSYYLETNLANVFLKGSEETIWQLLPVVTSNNQPKNNTWEGNLILPATNNSLPTYIVTNGLLNAFENTDQRKSAWITSRLYGSQQILVNYPAKYKIKANNAITEYYVVFRLAEQYLVRAEARAQLGRLAEAQADLNMIRNRAGLSNTSATGQTDLLLAIEQERRVELFAEWGHRWYDLKRTNRADAVLGLLKPTWSHDDALWPIPVSQLSADPFLTQNPGY